MAGAAAARPVKKRRKAVTHVIPADVTQFARRKGIYRSLLKATEIVRQTTPALRGIRVEVSRDPEVVGWTTLCFHIRTRAGVEAVLAGEDALCAAMYERIGARDRCLLAFLYEFE